MKHIETIYLGCDNTGEHASIDNHIIKFDTGTSHAHATILSHFGSILFLCQTLSQENVLNKPFKICVLIHDDLIDRKIKEVNNNTIDGTIRWFMQNWHPPACGIIFSMYSYKTLLGIEIQERWSSQVIWPLQQKWQSTRSGNYITVHMPEEKLLSRPSSKIDDLLKTGQLQVIQQIQELCDIDVKYVDYIMHEDDLFNILSKSKMHFTYPGATYYSAGIINLPTVCYGYPLDKLKHSSRYWLDGKEHQVDDIRMTQWNRGDNNPMTKVPQYCFKRNSVVQRPQQYVIHTQTPEGLAGYIKGFPFKVGNRTYSIYD